MGERAGEDLEEGMRHSGHTTCAGRLKAEFRLRHFGLSHPTPRLFVSSQWGYPRFYLGWRVFWAVYHVAWIVYDWTHDAINTERPGTWMVYLTNWGYTLLTFNTVILALLQIYITCTRKEFKEGEGPWYLKVTWLVYTLACDASLLITVLFFALLFDGVWKLLSTVTHLATTVYVILDLAVTAMPVRLLHAIYAVIFAVVYVVFNVIYWAAGGVNSDGKEYIYEPLDWSKPEEAAPLAVGVAFVGVPLQHVIFWSLYMIRIAVWNWYERRDSRRVAKSNTDAVARDEAAVVQECTF